MPDLVPIILGLFLLAAFLRIDAYFHIVYLLTAVYILARLWSYRSMKQLEASRLLVNRAFPGENIDVELRVRNKGSLPIPWVEVHDALPVDMISPPFYREVISLRGREERRFHYALAARKRGYYVIGPLIWRTGDLVGVTPQLVSTHAAEYIIVYPRVVSLEKLGLPTISPLASLPAPAPLFEDTSRIMGVRPYQAGDSPRAIHWTATASSGSLLVKRYQPAIARETLICLDLDQTNYEIRRLYEATELAVITAASIANHIAVRERLAVGLTVQALDPLEERLAQMTALPRRERAHLMAILEILARAQAYRAGQSATVESALPFVDYLRQQCMGLSWGTTVIVITGSESQALFDSLVYLRRRGFAVALILAMPPPPMSESRGWAATSGVPVYRLWQEEDLEIV